MALLDKIPGDLNLYIGGCVSIFSAAVCTRTIWDEEKTCPPPNGRIH
jgi:hypothetical protein